MDIPIDEAAAVPPVQPDESAEVADVPGIELPNDDAAAVTREQLKEALEELITPETITKLTRRVLRAKLEERFGLQAGSIECRKQEINEMVREVMDELQPPPPEETTPKKRKHEETSEAEGGSESEGEARSSKRSRKGAKKAQSSIMTKSHFCETAEALVSNIGPLQFTVTPREFSTGSCGWFYGSKHELPVGEEKVMCQLTINCAVLGSKQWKP
eukprot:Protomagalhaensia_wolfi_Nauph_80__5765@NODE_704_length_2089_cov_40_581951_g526_i0_p1_GENE_NODE_704_length_2089_cov_40_581951_g526_i0NODE_704_length_2089_cov_40_581951_g526_i0_p1_ORF_typecomplete_len215_score50_68DEK_C/PF08766_11/6_3e06CobT/PF06213_12/0_038SOBP/PF15279_6/0_045DUF3738/PF12543_8/0_17mRNA_decap_C/PF16741_5/0_24UBN_AB/PF14075_6/0_18Med19/PF10278_9/0_32_NODE_704_length_2089_cov_40_581951_g526_i091735